MKSFLCARSMRISRVINQLRFSSTNNVNKSEEAKPKAKLVTTSTESPPLTSAKHERGIVA